MRPLGGGHSILAGFTLMSRRRPIILPYVFERLWQRLTDHFAVDVPRVLRVYELVVIALGFQHACKALIRDHPITPLGRGGFCAYIVFRNMHPDAERLHRTVGEGMF